MARRLFFVPAVKRDVAELHDEMAQHLTRVLRVEAGQLFEISDNENLYLAEVEVARKSLVSFRVKQRLEPRPAPYPVTLYASLFKFDHFEWMIEKATELGAASLQPLHSERSVLRLTTERAERKREHWQALAAAACEQCGRSLVPKVLPVQEFADLMAALSGRGTPASHAGTTRWLLSPGADLGLAEALTTPLPSAGWVLSGPEGGFSPREEASAIAAGWQPLGLGPRVLRADTAPLVALAAWGLRPRPRPAQ